MVEKSPMQKLYNYKKIIRILLLAVFDIVLLNWAVVLSLAIRADFGFANSVFHNFLSNYADIWIYYTLGSIAIFYVFRLYDSLWEYAGVHEGLLVVVSGVLSSIYLFAVSSITRTDFPISCYVISCVLLIFLILIERFSPRIIGSMKINILKGNSKRVMIIGAGKAASMLMLEIRKRNAVKAGRVICIIDDDPLKKGRYFDGIKIVGGRDKIVSSVKKYKIDEIIIAMPSASLKEKTEIISICKETGCKTKTVPSLYQIVNEEISISKLREVDIEDLLGRESVEIDIDSIMGYVKDKVVMVTGGGGSIGSELCRQIAMYNPKQLIIFDIYENNVYDIENQLKRKYKNLNVISLIGSVRDTDRLESVFSRYKPDIVYHAAAHKHVPLMENSPNEAIKNNVFGTLNTVKAADKYGVKRFVLISTDKAVNPTNIMGASKRLCEMIIQLYNKKSDTEFVAVRFGNVLGSNGSVIPLFKKQIEEGGPVTITHPDIIRYFMTIPEAAALVLQAGALAKGGEIFVLNMGNPVKILDLAENLIKLSGYTPYTDIKIEFTGLRPGEKLYEELLMDEEGLIGTDNELIYIGKPIEFDEDKFLDKLEKLSDHIKNDSPEIKEIIKELVTTYK